MKKIALVAIACLFSGVMTAQKLKDTEVPAAVKVTFGKSFPKARDVKWSKENAEEFEAEFKSDGREMSVNYTNAGIWTGTETEIKKTELPKAVQDAIAKEFAGYKIAEAERAEVPGNEIAYETELEKGAVKWEVKFSAGGLVLMKEEKKEKDDKKD